MPDSRSGTAAGWTRFPHVWQNSAQIFGSLADFFKKRHTESTPFRIRSSCEGCVRSRPSMICAILNNSAPGVAPAPAIFLDLPSGWGKMLFLLMKAV